MSRAVLLFSGGLDSILAFKVLENAGVTPIPLFFETPFFSREKPLYYAEKNHISINVHSIFTEHKKILLKPKMGYGKNLNPCIDCHALMINSALGLMEKYNADFAATGEVLGQRPMSQNRHAFTLMEHIITRPDMVLRPLCAKLMEETDMEKEGLVDREKLYSFTGRSRNAQMKLAEHYNITEFPPPAGGCLLTQSQFTDKLKVLIEMEMLTERNAELIKLGRLYRMKDALAVIGRDRECNIRIEEIGHDMTKYQIENSKGPVAVIIGTPYNNEMEEFKKHLLSYSKNAQNSNIVSYT